MLATPAAALWPSETALDRIDRLCDQLDARYAGRIRTDPSLSRQTVSFQASKHEPVDRWYKYKEAFSSALVRRFLADGDLPNKAVLDPFAGIGTTLFASAALGYTADGIELLPVGQAVIGARSGLSAHVADRVATWQREQPWREWTNAPPIPELRITRGAYPPDTMAGIAGYLAALDGEPDAAHAVLRLALLAVLESISFTRKDGQYLRWDHRSPRTGVRGSFDKGRIVPFDEAIMAKLAQIMGDLATLPDATKGSTHLMHGSCLDILPTLPADHYGAVITSPPYCNRYDYTRTYALEHALLGVSEAEQVRLRQAMLSCTVENKAKALTAINPAWRAGVDACTDCDVLQAVLAYLDGLADAGAINNGYIPRMVRGYFDEMACVVQELSRVVAPGGRIVMVNDNVRYAGAAIPVDTILSSIAERFGLVVESILVLPQNKGNSSQQMGAHGRAAMRKSVYVWRKPA